ncbi:Protein MtfA [Planctomycetes bacterium Pan216]|uniref:Protein MtfA n=1 Tax=Kolteria novifilia TaxID=2527975 RepID=A0A518B6P8_9BACT|nr:Protein MtfA [Planctomycetes bacterium Pan216]
MLLSWLRQRRRRQILANPFPEEWHAYLERNVHHYLLLTDEERRRLRNDLQILIAEKNWEGCNGLEINEEIQVTIAAQACLLTLAIPHDYYPGTQSILVYPYGYVAKSTRVLSGGMVWEGDSGRLGESWQRGPVILSWADAYQGGRCPRDGHNLVLHEFAHKLDMLIGTADGTPPLGDYDTYRRWKEVMGYEFERLQREAELGRPTVLDPYGATNPAEFFAVSTECFFELPRRLRGRHPELYGLLQEFYQQDPAGWDWASLRSRCP